jgi:pilus assembly protein Flp/PilA
MRNLITRFVNDDSGPSAIEYGLIAGLISIVAVAAMTLIGQNLQGTYNAVAAAF